MNWGHWCVNYKTIEDTCRRDGIGINGRDHRPGFIALRPGIWVLYEEYWFLLAALWGHLYGRRLGQKGIRGWGDKAQAGWAMGDLFCVRTQWSVGEMRGSRRGRGRRRWLARSSGVCPTSVTHQRKVQAGGRRKSLSPRITTLA